MEKKAPENVSDPFRIDKNEPSSPFKFSSSEIVLAWVMLAIGFLYWNLLLEAWGFGLTLFTLIISGVTLIFLNKSGFRQTCRSWFWLAVLLLCALSFSIFAATLLNFVKFLFLNAVFMYWLSVSTGRNLNDDLSAYLIGDAFNQIFIVPFSNFLYCFKGLKASLSGRKNSKNVLYLLLGMVIFFPFIAAVLKLLMAADSAFAQFIWHLGDVIVPGSNIIDYIFQFLLGIPVAFYLYGLIFGNVHDLGEGRFKRETLERAALNIRIAPQLTIYSALTVFNVIYILYTVFQSTYFFSSLTGSLPDSFTYAEYARKGFFELCAVASINLAVMLIAYVFIKRGSHEEPKALRVQLLCLSLLTILLIITAGSKMIMYINFYGLTPMRTYTSWFMALLFFVFTVILIRQLKKFNASKWLASGALALFMLLTFSNADGFIAHYNIERYKSGTLNRLDLDMLGSLSDAAIPHIYALYQDMGQSDPDDRMLKARLKNLIVVKNPLEEGNGIYNYRNFNWQKYNAREISREIQKPAAYL
ncbi:MAG: DUF4173 domain-containing protein [Syntrophomonadaceae bacterium]|jgi:hypothetical protein|nr:DUF4173 domain-containing protein [Syntrophomonadaceae bacterium]